MDLPYDELRKQALHHYFFAELYINCLPENDDLSRFHLLKAQKYRWRAYKKIRLFSRGATHR